MVLMLLKSERTDENLCMSTYANICTLLVSFEVVWGWFHFLLVLLNDGGFFWSWLCLGFLFWIFYLVFCLFWGCFGFFVLHFFSYNSYFLCLVNVQGGHLLFGFQIPFFWLKPTVL